MANPKALLGELSEAELARELERRLERAGVRWYHTHDSRRSAPGYPDYTIIAGDWLLFAELKRKAGSPTADQVAWLRDLRGSMRLAVLAGGLEGVELLARLVERISSGAVSPVELGAASYAVQVLGRISPRGILAVGASADARPDGGRAAVAAPMRRRQCRRDTGSRPRGS
jgi:hypothetical protein